VLTSPLGSAAHVVGDPVGVADAVAVAVGIAHGGQVGVPLGSALPVG
jgi:hypothetical protein